MKLKKLIRIVAAVNKVLDWLLVAVTFLAGNEAIWINNDTKTGLIFIILAIILAKVMRRK